LFISDRAFCESSESKRKWQKVQALIAEARKLAMIHFNRGAQHLSSKQPDLAIAEFYRAADFGGDLSQMLFFIAKAYGEKRDYEMMKKIGQLLIEAQKRDPRGYQILGLAYYNSGDKETSKQLLARAKFLESNSRDLANKN
jgi:tetratricopeptide (TPR) repeat protein